MKRKRYLITGAGGTIGIALLKNLIKKNNLVCAFDSDEERLFNISQKYSKYRNKLELFLTENNIQVRRYFATMDKQPFLKKMLHRKIGDLKKSNQILN